MNEEQEERLVKAAEMFALASSVFATAIKGIHEEAKRVSNRLWPERTQLREAVVTRIPTAEDKAREEQGATDTRPVREWATSFGDDSESGPVIGTREREYLSRQEKRPDTPPGSKTGGQAG